MTVLKQRTSWYAHHTRRRHPNPATCARVRQSIGLADEPHYSRAMRSLSNAPLSDLFSAETYSKLAALHPTPAHPFTPLPPDALLLAPFLSFFNVRRAAQSINQSSAPGPDCMSPFLLHILHTTCISPETGVTGLNILTDH